ncbi:guanylate kinase [Candidatus Vallotiella sp. (ex Adelges kitamiensis)]|uniref:guanylate kinase n=1 Tax=Candidatus Vallotiella sp. (ex Adelges kitamiensis) TaxID=2864217 RepID=UPI001CE238EC|nr:guanylate kinase [Candidatus Vallotia sp. (ex Adelges kitamiensis)]
MTNNQNFYARAYPGNLFMVVAPSGAGKSTLISALLACDSLIRMSVSYTTRPPRLNEENNVQYHFISVSDFQELYAQDKFLESAVVHGHYYGTSRAWIEEQMENEVDILLEIDWQGAQQVRKKFRNAVGIFILPPSLDALRMRLHKRGQDEQNVIADRLLTARREISHAPEFEYVLINETFDHALTEMQSIVTSRRLCFLSQRARHENLFVELGIHSP